MDLETKIKIKFNKLSNLAIVPTRANDGDAGYDLFSCDHLKIGPMRRALVGTGISIEIPKGYYGRIAPRSGLAVKKGIDVLAGVIDSTYRGEIKVVLINLNMDVDSIIGNTPSFMGSSYDFSIKPGDRIAQIIIEKYHAVEWQEANQLSSTERQEAGFGSTGV